MVTDQPTVAVERSGGRQQCVTHVHTLNHDSLFKLLLQWSLLELVLKTMLRQSQLFVTVITISVASIFILFTRQSSYDAFIPSLPALPQMHHLPRVLCWVNTHPGNHAKKAVHLAATWGRWDMKLIWRIPKNRWFYIFLYLSIPGVATSFCSWARWRTRGLEALPFPISPTDAPLFGTRLKRFSETYFISL